MCAWWQEGVGREGGKGGGEGKGHGCGQVREGVGAKVSNSPCPVRTPPCHSTQACRCVPSSNLSQSCPFRNALSSHGYRLSAGSALSALSPSPLSPCHAVSVLGEGQRGRCAAEGHAREAVQPPFTAQMKMGSLEEVSARKQCPGEREVGKGTWG